MNQVIKKTRITKLLVLAVTATLMAELFTGSTPLSRCYMLVSELIMYGSGVILIRETARRLNLGWASIILLGFAYGLLEEGLTLQSVFNPHFLGFDNSFGRMGGINWIWSEYISGLHCFWSITGAIIVSELIFFKQKNERWISNTGLWICAIIFILICASLHFLFIKISHYNAAPTGLLLNLLLVLAIIFLAIKLPAGRIKIQQEQSKSVLLWAIFFITLMAGVAWFLGLGTVFMETKPDTLIVFICGAIILLIYFLLIKKVCHLNMDVYKQRLVVAVALLLIELMWGYLLTRQNPVDHYGHIIIIILVLLFIYFLFKRENKLNN